jgi:hypothetical protein
MDLETFQDAVIRSRMDAERQDDWNMWKGAAGSRRWSLQAVLASGFPQLEPLTWTGRERLTTR